MIVALVEDLFFSSKITETARQLTLVAKGVTDRDTFLQELEFRPQRLIIDLNFPCCNPVELIRELKQRGLTIPMVAVASHVQADLVKAGEEAGCDRVVARSYFSGKRVGIILNGGNVDMKALGGYLPHNQ